MRAVRLRVEKIWKGRSLASSQKRQDQSKILARLTIIIPTKGRTGRALAKAHFWAGHGCTVHVLDASEDCDIESYVGRLSRVHYHHDPAAKISSRLARVGSFVETPYVMVQPDDDVFLAGALRSIVDSLGNDPAAVGASGVAIKLQQSGFGSYSMKVAYPQALKRAKQSGHTGRNLPGFMRHYYPSVIYGIVRTDVFKTVVKHLGNLKTGPYAIEELFFEMGVNGMGRVLTLPDVYWVRNPHVPSVESRKDRSSVKGNQPWFLRPQSLDHQIFLEELAKVFESGNGVTTGCGSELAKQGISAYSAFFLAKHAPGSKKFGGIRAHVTFLKSRILTKKPGMLLRFLRDFLLAITMPSRRSLGAALMQPRFTFMQEATKADLAVDREELVRALKSLH